jgi:hypothetical protein
MSLRPGFWGSENFWQPPRRSWPYPPTRLERIAESMGIGDEELRELLRAEIELRRHECARAPLMPQTHS